MKKAFILFLTIIMMNSFPEMMQSDVPAIPVPDGYSDTIKQSLRIGDFIYLVGFSRNLETNQTDGLFIGYDSALKSVKFRFVYDIGYDESFVFIGLLDDNILGVVSRNTSVSSLYLVREFETTEILEFDTDGFVQGKLVLESDYVGFANLGYKMILMDAEENKYSVDSSLEMHPESFSAITTPVPYAVQHTGNAWVNYQRTETISLTVPGYYHVEVSGVAISVEYDVIASANPAGLSDGSIFEDPVSIVSGGELFLNGVSIDSGIEVVDPGHYSLDILGVRGYEETMTFTIQANVVGIFPGEQTKEPVQISSNALRMTLNDLDYDGSTVSEVGHYTLSLFGVGSYREDLVFSILPSVVGVDHLGIYDQPVTIYANGEAYLNGTRMREIETIETTGDYMIQIYFDDELVEEKFFTVEIDEAEPEENPSMHSEDTAFYLAAGGLLLFGLFLIFRKK